MMVGTLPSPRTQRSGRETLHLQRLDIHMSIGAG